MDLDTYVHMETASTYIWLPENPINIKVLRSLMSAVDSKVFVDILIIFFVAQKLKCTKFKTKNAFEFLFLFYFFVD